MVRFLVSLTISLFPALAAALPLEGTWNQGCNAFDGGSSTSELHIHNGSWMRLTINYADGTCTEPWLETREVFWGALSGTSSLDVTWKDVSYKPLTNDLTATLRDMTYCDLTNWMTDEWTDVTGTTCGPFAVPGAGQMVYSIFHLSEPDSRGMQTLRLGESSTGFEGTSPSRRHVIYEPSPYRRIFSSPGLPEVSTSRTKPASSLAFWPRPF